MIPLSSNLININLKKVVVHSNFNLHGILTTLFTLLPCSNMASPSPASPQEGAGQGSTLLIDC